MADVRNVRGQLNLTHANNYDSNNDNDDLETVALQQNYASLFIPIDSNNNTNNNNHNDNN